MESMILDNLKLRCYRNLAHVDVTWSGHFNVIYGQNAQGKTNLLEALYYLAQLWPQVNRPDRAAQANKLLKSRYAGSPWADK